MFWLLKKIFFLCGKSVNFSRVQFPHLMEEFNSDKGYRPGDCSNPAECNKQVLLSSVVSAWLLSANLVLKSLEGPAYPVRLDKLREGEKELVLIGWILPCHLKSSACSGPNH